MRAVVTFLGTLSFSLFSCGGAEIAEPHAKASSVEQAPFPQAVDTEPSEADSLLELVRGNVATTDLSAVVEIESARVEGPNGGPAPVFGYVNHVYTVKILTPIAGCSGVKSFEFAEMADADSRPKAVGTVLCVSVCRDGEGSFHTPDVGYAIPRADLPASAVAELAANPPAKADSVCGE